MRLNLATYEAKQQVHLCRSISQPSSVQVIPNMVAEIWRRLRVSRA
jgi:hypothetical protein